MSMTLTSGQQEEEKLLITFSWLWSLALAVIELYLPHNHRRIWRCTNLEKRLMCLINKWIQNLLQVWTINKSKLGFETWKLHFFFHNWTIFLNVGFLSFVSAPDTLQPTDKQLVYYFQGKDTCYTVVSYGPVYYLYYHIRTGYIPFL